MSDFQIAVRPISKKDADDMRADIVRLLLTEIVNGLKTRIDLVSWLNAGWVELEDLASSLCTGGQHPALVAWEVDKSTGGHPVPPVRELYARRMVVLMCTALTRAGLGKKEARDFAVDKLAGVFDPAPTERTIRYWQDEQPELTRQDELLVAGGFATGGGVPDRLAIYFIALVHLALNPSAVAIAKNPPDYFGSRRSA